MHTLITVMGIYIWLVVAVVGAVWFLWDLTVLTTRAWYYKRPEGIAYRGIVRLIDTAKFDRMKEHIDGHLVDMSFQEPNTGYWYFISYAQSVCSVLSRLGLLVDVVVHEKEAGARMLNRRIYDIKLPAVMRGELYAKAKRRFNAMQREANRQRRKLEKHQAYDDLICAAEDLNGKPRRG